MGQTMILEFSKTRPSAIDPVRANPSDAGLDIFYCPETHPSDTDASVTLGPNESGLFQTGLKFGIPHGYMLEVKNRSGNAAKEVCLLGLALWIQGTTARYLLTYTMLGTRHKKFNPA